MLTVRKHLHRLHFDWGLKYAYQVSAYKYTWWPKLSAILVPRGLAPIGQHQESRPLARSNDIPVLNGFVNTIDWDQNQSDLSDLTLSMRRVTGSPLITDSSVGPGQRSRFLVLTKRSAASGDENGYQQESIDYSVNMNLSLEINHIYA